MPTHDEITVHHDNDPGDNPWVLGPPPPETVVLVPYDPDWPRRYQRLAAAVRAALGDTALDIEHIGSTSVEGLAAKDVIDIDLTVADPARTCTCSARTVPRSSGTACSATGCAPTPTTATATSRRNDRLFHAAGMR